MSDETDLSGLIRPIRPAPAQESLFGEVEFEWRAHWWGMPSFVMGDARPIHRLTVNFMTYDDLSEFAARIGLRLTRQTDSIWFPPESLDRPSEWEYTGERRRD